MARAAATYPRRSSQVQRAIFILNWLTTVDRFYVGELAAALDLCNTTVTQTIMPVLQDSGWVERINGRVWQSLVTKIELLEASPHA